MFKSLIEFLNKFKWKGYATISGTWVESSTNKEYEVRFVLLENGFGKRKCNSACTNNRMDNTSHNLYVRYIFPWLTRTSTKEELEFIDKHSVRN